MTRNCWWPRARESFGAVAATAGNEAVLSYLEAGTDFATGKHGKAGSGV